MATFVLCRRNLLFIYTYIWLPLYYTVRIYYLFTPIYGYLCNIQSEFNIYLRLCIAILVLCSHIFFALRALMIDTSGKPMHEYN